MKKVLMFQDYFYYGGIERIILDIKNNLKYNYQIDILSFVNKSKYNIKSLLNKEYRNFFIRNIHGIIKFKKYLSENNYDIIHIHAYNSFGLIYAFISKKYVEKIIIHAHNNDIDNDILYIKHFINFIIKLLFKNKKYTYIAASKEANNFCFNNKNTIILPNCINYSDFLFNENERNYYRKLFDIKPSDIVIGHIGRFEKQKNHKFIIEIFNKINSQSDNYKLFLIGEGSLKNKIKDKICKERLEKKVYILDNRSDISKLINMFDIYLFPSIYEGFGITAVENEVNGKYVFVSDKVPKNIAISNRIKFISLKKSSLEWANEITNIKEKKLKLKNDLDIKNYIEKIDNIYKL